MQAAINAVIGIKRKSTSSGVSNNIEKGADAVDVPVIPISDDVTIIPTTDIPKVLMPGMDRFMCINLIINRHLSII